MAIDSFALPVDNIVKGVTPDQFFIPGSIMKVDYDTRHPLAFGMPQRGVGFFSRSLVFRVRPDAAGGPAIVKAVASYPSEPLLLSGFSHNDTRIQGGAAVVDATLGKGKVILFGFNVVNRYQTPANLRLLFNALYFR
jgi:hypothetical protein